MSDALLTIPNATPCYSDAYGDYVLIIGENGIEGVLGVFGEAVDPWVVQDARPVAWDEPARLFGAVWLEALAERGWLVAA